MARVHLARSVGPGGFTKPVALKVLRSEFAETPEAAELLLHEARVAAQLHHPNIVQVFDLGQADGKYFMAMEWVDGLSLNHLFNLRARAEQVLAVDFAAYIAQQVGEALAYLKGGIMVDGVMRSLVHRDVSPSNILLSTSGAVKLTDFGVVKVLDVPTLTEAGMVKGKYSYMSPEQLRGGQVGHASDIFSLGVVLFEILTSHRLFHRSSVAATIAAAHAARVVAPSKLNPTIPKEIDEIVVKALEKAPENRYAEANDLIQDLLPFTSLQSRSRVAEAVQDVLSNPLFRDQTGIRSRLSLPLVPSESLASASQVEESEETALANLNELEERVLASDPASGQPKPLEVTAMDIRSRVAARPNQPTDRPFSEPSESDSHQVMLALLLIALTLSAAGVFWWLVLYPPSRP